LIDIITEGQMAAFHRVLDPLDNSTGGGTASAVAGAMAAALVAMVARLSVGANAVEGEAFYQGIAREAGGLREALLAGAEEDARSFDAVMAAFRLPKATDAEKQTRRAAIQEATVYATRVPLHNAEHCAEVLALAAQLEGRSNPRALSDLQSAGYLARAGLQGCLANVDINLPGVKDETVAGEIRGRATALNAA